MTQLACVDGVVDPSELRIIESYATSWAVPPEDVEAWVERYRAQYATDLQRFFRRVRTFFVAPRTSTYTPTSERPGDAARTPGPPPPNPRRPRATNSPAPSARCGRSSTA